MSSKLSASPRTAHTAITRMSSSRCSTFHAHLGSSTVSNAAIKVSSMASLRRKAEPLAGQAAEIEALTSCVTPDQEVAHPRVAHLGDRAAPRRLPGGALARHQAEVAHQLARALEAADVADLDHERHRRDQVDAAQRLQRLDQRGEAPGREELPDRPIEAREPLLREPHALDALLQHDLVGRVLEALRLQPAAVAGTPVLL